MGKQKNIPGTGSLISLFARHSNASNLVMVLMVIFGIFSIGRINTQFFPSIDINTVVVTYVWAGASAEDVETNILQIVEPEIRFMEGVDNITSVAREGVGTIVLEYAASQDMQKAQDDLESVVKAITNLPDDVETPKFRRAAFFDRIARLAITGNVSEQALRIYAKKIRDDLIARGIDKVSFVGLRDVELQAEIPEREMRRLGLTISDISRSIASNSRDLPSGQIRGRVEKQLRALADVKSVKSLGNVEVKSFRSGEKVKLRDIAKVRRGFDADQPTGFSSGNRAIQVTIERAANADTLATAKIFEDYYQEIKNNLPPGIHVKKYDVRANALVQRIMLLIRNGVGGLVLVIGILFIFLNARIALWVAMGIPTAMLATIGVMYVMGQSINMVSLFGLIMMLGIIVDDAIVVGEHTATRFDEGDGPYEAAENGAGRMVTPVLAAMITTIAAFGPIWVIGGVIGQIFSVLPLVVFAVILASLVECFLVLPGHLAHTLHPRKRVRWSWWRQFFFSLAFATLVVSISTRMSGVALPAMVEAKIALLNGWKEIYGLKGFIAIVTLAGFAVGTCLEALFVLTGAVARRFAGRFGGSAEDALQGGLFRRSFDAGFNWFRDKPFNAIVRGAYDFRYVTISIAIGAVMVMVYGMIVSGKVGFVFFPSAEAESLSARVVFNAGIPENEAVAAVKRIENALQVAERKLTNGKETLVIASFVTLGASGRNTGDNLASIRVQLTTSEQRTVRTPDFVVAWHKAIPKIAGVRRVSIFEHRGGPPGRDIDIQLQGANAAVLKSAATEIIDLVAPLPGVSGIADDLPYGKPELVMELLPRGAALGLSINDIGKQVRDAFQGIIPRRFAEGDDEVTIRITQIMRNRGAAALRNFELKSPSGEFVPLSEVVRITERQGFAKINRENGKATISVTGDIDTAINTTEKVIAALENSGLPGIASKYGITYKFGGKSKESKDAFADLGIGAAIALSIIYIILAWVFASYWKPIAVMMIIPFGIVGAVFGHWVLGYKLTILSMAGLLGLAGILVNDSIILVARMDERLQFGQPIRTASIGASLDRLRAVLLTSLTTVGGLLPLLFEKSLQAQFLLPMAITIVFGLASATLLVLFLVPALMAVGEDISWALRAIYGRRPDPVETRAAE